jgi:hypothetical protein
VRRLYEDILAIAKNYMGPAADDYIRRRIRIVQAGKPPEEIEPDKLDRLAAGIDMTAKGYLSELKAGAFRDEILALKKRYNGKA